MKNINPAMPLAKMAAALMEGETDAVANMANLSALISQYTQNINWAGFYIFKDGGLILGPFQGLPACIRISLGSGVCGAAAQRRETIVVEDVHAFPGHIACDAASKSEIVLPIIKPNGELFGVLDIDSPVTHRFGPEDKKIFEDIVEVFVKATNLN